ncbi:MAG: PilZ domain-containing protein [Nitrospirota bacterium]|nr:PilZ domain-containing protein [Nitrospirota bacterium]
MHSTSRYPIMGSNVLWLTVATSPNNILIKSSILGLGPDHSLLCAIPDDQPLETLSQGLRCKGRSNIDGEIFEFETVIQEFLSFPSAIRLTAPQTILRQIPRSFPRLTVDLPGVVRPLSRTGQILAVLPVQLSNLSPTGCQITIDPSTWPRVSALHLYLSCRLPGFNHQSKIQGSIEWVHPTNELVIGIQFFFQTDKDIVQQDVLQWYSSQKATIVNTTA